MTRNVLLLTYGTRGDVEPFVALGLGLRRAGFAVSLATATRFRTFVEGFGLGFHPITDAPLALIETPDGKAMIEGAAGMVGRIAAGIRLLRKSAPLNRDMLLDAWAAAQAVRPDLIVFHPKMMAAPHIAQAMGIPVAMGAFQPLVVPTREFPASLQSLPIPGFNRLSYHLVALSYAAFRKSVNAFRAEALDLPPVPSRSEVLRPGALGDYPVLHAISPQVLPRPADWPDHAHMTGYWRLPGADTPLLPEVEDFLNAGAPPVFVGFGSMTSSDPESLTRTVSEALRLSGQRGVIAAGWAGLKAEESERLITIPPLPYGSLFPRMAVIVHHGGAGTTAEGLHAGVPAVVCPFFGDQPFWARRTVDLGVGAPPVPCHRLSAERLARSIRIAAHDAAMRARARDLAGRLAQEDGVAAAMDILTGL